MSNDVIRSRFIDRVGAANLFVRERKSQGNLPPEKRRFSKQRDKQYRGSAYREVSYPSKGGVVQLPGGGGKLKKKKKREDRKNS